MSRVLLSATFLATGVLHFLKPRTYPAVMPRSLHARTARPAGWWLIALAGIFPANVAMAVHAERFRHIPRPLLWARRPRQPLLIAWAWKTATR
jgi:uncharacterized membrane protein